MRRQTNPGKKGVIDTNSGRGIVIGVGNEFEENTALADGGIADHENLEGVIVGRGASGSGRSGRRRSRREIKRRGGSCCHIFLSSPSAKTKNPFVCSFLPCE
ncbi:unnamed protein product [Linum trigynum]|uniref:Uncharacterized protein n=1 Tax=Linum trigynum TaxID=586398 RepID=A0AAV2ELV9_9ROSI